MAEKTSDDRKQQLRGRLVEGVRLIFMPLFGAAAFQLGSRFGDITTSRNLLWVFLGAACGFVLGGVIGRLTLRAVSGIERELRRTPAPQIAGGVVGVVVGLVVASLLSLP